MTEMIERVARAIAGSPDNWYGSEDNYRQQARAVIGVMREPTEEMNTQGTIERYSCLGTVPEVYRAMIDAALSSEKE